MSESAAEQLLWGIKNGEVDQVKESLKMKKMDINQELVSGRKALHIAADYGQTNVIECLLDAGADINAPDKYDITPLLAAIWENHLEAVKFLLNKGAKKDGKSPDGKSYIDCAETDDMKMLLK
ncbi:hypothetical protein ACF0H5_016456 [Mactra antiquata]